MNVRIVPRGQPQRTDLYSGVGKVLSNGKEWLLITPFGHPIMSCGFGEVAELLLDDEGDYLVE